VIRHDYAHPLRVDASSHQVARSDYAHHVSQLVLQLLLTSPGERVCLPEFGCGLRRLVFAPQTDALVTTVTLQVQQAMTAWLSDQVELTNVTVRSGAQSGTGLDEGTVEVQVEYTLIETRTPDSVSVRVV